AARHASALAPDPGRDVAGAVPGQQRAVTERADPVAQPLPRHVEEVPGRLPGGELEVVGGVAEVVEHVVARIDQRPRGPEFVQQQLLAQLADAGDGQRVLAEAGPGTDLL